MGSCQTIPGGRHIEAISASEWGVWIIDQLLASICFSFTPGQTDCTRSNAGHIVWTRNIVISVLTYAI